MKLSDIKGERTLDVIAEIIDPIANIAEDKAASDLFHKKKLPKGMDEKKFILNRARKAVPALLKGHKNDIIHILSAIEGTSPEEYAASLDLAKLFADAIDLVSDDTFKSLFISAQNGESSGSAQGNTEDPHE